jgi:Fe-S cluster assembly scaffold protein SufB
MKQPSSKINEQLVRTISQDKKEPEWMLQKRLKSLEIFHEKPIPDWGPDLSELKLEEINYFVKANAKKNSRSWNDVPKEIRETYEKLGIPEAEKKALAGVGAQYDSEIIYHNIKEELEKQGVIFLDMDVAVQTHPELVKEYFMTTCIKPELHKFSALHGAVWSGGTFIYIPKNTKIDLPLQAYFRMNASRGGQFEHTLIIADEGSELHYIEGCSSPIYSENALHAGCVEIHVLKNAKVRYSSIENWSKNVYNLNTKRGIVHENGILEWVNGNLGCLVGNSKVFTKKGVKNIKDIKPGEELFVWDEKTNSIKESIVNKKIFSGDKIVYKVEAGGREIEASSNHPFLNLVRRKNKPEHKKGFFHTEWKPLEELKIGDIIGISKKLPIKGKNYTLPKIEIGKVTKSNNQYSKFEMNTSHLYNKKIIIPKETNADFMWLMGLILGDGHIDISNNKINIATHQNEDYREYLITLLKKLFNYTVTEKKERYIIINSKVLCQLFTELGLSGTANSKKIPEWVFNLPENQKLSFLAGYVDSDGHVSGNGLYLTSINKDILESVRILGIQIGLEFSKIFQHGKARIVEIRGIKANAKDSWRIAISGERIKEIPLKCKIKREKLIKLKKRRKDISAEGMNFKSKTTEEIGFVRINKIQEIGLKPTFDIEVKDYSNFIANGLVVHNSKTTMLYPCSILKGDNSKTEYLGIAYASKNQYQDTGCKVYHIGKNTSSFVVSKGISKSGGISSYRGLVKISKNAINSKTSVKCDGLMLDNESKVLTFPSMDVHEEDIQASHEATVGKIGEEQLFYLMSRGLSEEEATKMIVSGFMEPVIKELPLEYAAELNKLIELEIENSVC